MSRRSRSDVSVVDEQEVETALEWMALGVELERSHASAGQASRRITALRTATDLRTFDGLGQ